MKIKVIVTLKNGVLDPQGKAIQQTLNGMGFSDLNKVRQGKYFEIDINDNDETKAKEATAVVYSSRQVVEKVKLRRTINKKKPPI